MIDLILIPILLITLVACVLCTLVDSIIAKVSEVSKKYQFNKRIEGVNQLENRRAFVNTEKIQRS